MKCEKCGKNIANYHYISDINGDVTEKHLCSACAGELEHETDLFSGAEQMMDSLFDSFFGRRSLPAWGGFGRRMTMPALALPRIVVYVPEKAGQAAPETAAPEKTEQEKVDPEMQRKRELNMLREQMRAAAEKEDFEKAAEIRDKIKKLEQEN